MSEQTDTWTSGIEYILEEIRENSIIISDYHKDRYMLGVLVYQKQSLKKNSVAYLAMQRKPKKLSYPLSQ